MEALKTSAAPGGEDELRARLGQRLEVLRAEHAKGEEMLRSLDAQRQGTAETLLRISGAIQVLQEELGAGQPPVALAG